MCVFVIFLLVGMGSALCGRCVAGGSGGTLVVGVEVGVEVGVVVVVSKRQRGERQRGKRQGGKRSRSTLR